MAGIDKQLVQFTQVSAAESVIVTHEDLESIARGRKAQGCCQNCGKGKTHLERSTGELDILL